MRDAELREQVVGAATSILAPDAARLERERDVGARVEVREQGEVLEDDADGTQLDRDEPPRRPVEPHLVAERDAPVGRADEAGDRTQQRRLAGTGEPRDRDGLAVCDAELGVEREVAQRNDDAG